MAPLVQLKDIALTFGGTALLAGVELSVSAGERVCLVGRNGSGKSTLLKIAAGLVEPDLGTRFLQPGATVRYLAQEPEFSGAATVLDYVMGGLGPGDDRHQAVSLLDELGLTGNRGSGAAVGRRGAARRHRLRARAATRHPAARRAHQSPRSSHHRMARAQLGGAARGARGDQP